MRFTLPASGRAAALVAATALVGAVNTTPASAAIQAGVLTCNIAGGVGAVVASQKGVSCKFRPSLRAPTEYYSGTLTRVGLDLSATGTGVLTYNVVSATDGYAPYTLAGSYFGPGVGLTIGNGIGLDALVGGNGNQVTLQPIAVSTSTGLGINAGIGSLSLVPAGSAPPRFHHHHHHYHA